MLALGESENDHNVMITNVININIPASVCGSLVGSNKNPFVVVTSSIGVGSTQVRGQDNYGNLKKLNLEMLLFLPVTPYLIKQQSKHVYHLSKATGILYQYIRC